jgi:hypothetical protein
MKNVVKPKASPSRRGLVRIYEPQRLGRSLALPKKLVRIYQTQRLGRSLALRFYHIF